MRKLIYTLLTAATIGSFAARADKSTSATQASGASKDAPAQTSPFAYPQAPDSLTSLEARTSYVMLNFWNNADMKKVMGDTAKFHRAFKDFVGFVPYAHIDSVRKAISGFTGRFANDPKAMTRIAAEAERTLFGPEADFWSEECYMMFLRPLLSNKKVKNKDKEHYLGHIRMLNSSLVGANISAFDYTTRHGAKHSLYDNKAEYFVVMFQPEDCRDCSMARLRLNADAATNELIKNGTVKLLIINPAKPSQKWADDMASYPYEWEIGSAPEVSELVDLRVMPNTYLLDNEFKILARQVDLNQLLALMATINHAQSMQQKSTSSPDSVN